MGSVGVHETSEMYHSNAFSSTHYPGDDDDLSVSSLYEDDPNDLPPLECAFPPGMVPNPDSLEIHDSRDRKYTVCKGVCIRSGFKEPLVILECGHHLRCTKCCWEAFVDTPGCPFYIKNKGFCNWIPDPFKLKVPNTL